MSDVYVTVSGADIINASVSGTSQINVSIDNADVINVTVIDGSTPLIIGMYQQGPEGIQGPKGDKGDKGDDGTSFSIPELDIDPVSPVAGYTWVKRNESVAPPILSHTLLQLGLTAPGVTIALDYELKYKTASGAVVSVPMN